MRVQGFDPSSSLAAVGNAIGGELVHVDCWRPPKKRSKDDALFNWFMWVGLQMDVFGPDLVGYEQVQSSRNMNTVRVLARWESAVIVQARKRLIIVQPVRVQQAREIVVGNAKAEKEEVLAALRVRYPRIGWSASNAGGLDQADAGVVALATPDLLERR